MVARLHPDLCRHPPGVFYCASWRQEKKAPVSMTRALILPTRSGRGSTRRRTSPSARRDSCQQPRFGLVAAAGHGRLSGAPGRHLGPRSPTKPRRKRVLFQTGERTGAWRHSRVGRGWALEAKCYRASPACSRSTPRSLGPLATKRKRPGLWDQGLLLPTRSGRADRWSPFTGAPAHARSA